MSVSALSVDRVYHIPARGGTAGSGGRTGGDKKRQKVGAKPVRVISVIMRAETRTGGLSLGSPGTGGNVFPAPLLATPNPSQRFLSHVTRCGGGQLRPGLARSRWLIMEGWMDRITGPVRYPAHYREQPQIKIPIFSPNLFR